VRDKVLQYIRERQLMRAGDRVAAAVSGGADSVALLRVMLDLRNELGIVLAVAHFNHGLRGEQAQADEAFVAELAKQHDLDHFVGHGDVRGYASTNKVSIEAAGRDLRYRWFARLAAEQRFDSIATAHTLDDQAETVLLKFLRGAGTRGLAGIYPTLDLVRPKNASGAKAVLQESARDGAPEEAAEKPRKQIPRWAEARLVTTKLEASGGLPFGEFKAGPEGPPHQINTSRRNHDYPCIIRPLLSVSRAEVETYLASLAQPWREDETNLDRRFTRNRVRHDLLPLLEREFNPNIRALLSDAAEVSRAEEEYWLALIESELALRLKPGNNAGLEKRRLLLDGFTGIPLALQRRLLKRFAEDAGPALDFDHIERLVGCVRGHWSKAELPSGWLAERKGDYLELHVLEAESGSAPQYEYILPVPGKARIAELGLTVRALIVAEESAREVTAGTLLDAALIGAQLTIRSWRPGDRFRPAHSRSEEKLKRLFAEKHIPAVQRLTWPVILHHEEIVWVRGFPVARAYEWKGGDAVSIEFLSA
jgi:tRNA(Ile)-lysidine synthase